MNNRWKKLALAFWGLSTVLLVVAWLLVILLQEAK